MEKQPFVSIHLACYNEPPEMVLLTLDSLAALDYENYEVLVIDNNTKDPASLETGRGTLRKTRRKFRFFHLEPWPGFKAGALNFGLKETDPRADIVAVVDADYEVRRRLAGRAHRLLPSIRRWPSCSARRRIATTSTTLPPHDHWEYDGFFRIGMHHRNERNAIIQHGTMTMVRRWRWTTPAPGRNGRSAKTPSWACA